MILMNFYLHDVVFADPDRRGPQLRPEVVEVMYAPLWPCSNTCRGEEELMINKLLSHR